jgi:dTDP-4-dehydrorhamnose 3,5-epimerase
MKFVPTALTGVYEIHGRRLRDERGDFIKLFQAEAYQSIAPQFQVREIYISRSHRGAIRGLHYQIPPFEMDKIIFCLKGAIYDVCVDLRSSSSTLGKHVIIELNETNGKGLFVSKGFAHGLQALCEDTVIINVASEVYTPSHERGIAWDSCGINWSGDTPIVSEKDQAQPRLEDLLAISQ